MKKINVSIMKVTKMIKEIDILLFVMTIIFSLISTCLPQYVKYPAKVTINEARASLQDSYELKIEGHCKTWNLKLAPMENIWSDVAQVVSITKDENETAVFERKNIPNNLRAYHDVNSGSILSVRSNEITGILDSHASIICENEEHFIVDLEKETKRKIDDILIPNEIPPKEFVTPFDEDKSNDTNITDAAPRMNDARDAEVIYTPEIVAIVDSELSNILRTDFKIYDYLNVFWNEIKVQYQYIDDPKINVKLVGALIIRDPQDEPFITNNLDENNKISVSAVIMDLIKYVYSKNYLIPPHDIVYLHTNKISDIDGIAAIGGACKIDTTRNISWSVAVGIDKNAVFAGTLTAAHELGHLLGANHDDKQINSCDFLDGYLMGYPHGTRNSYYFSNCSLQSITTKLAKSSSSCLTQNLKETTPPGVFNCSVLPGYIISMKDQCRYLSGDSTADVDLTTPEDMLCYNLQCVTKEGVWNSQVRAAERSLCPSGKRCSFGACV